MLEGLFLYILLFFAVVTTIIRVKTLFSFSEVRGQLSEQLKVLDAQLEQKTQHLQDLSDYLRRRGEIEAEYSRSLEKLSERFTLKTKK